MSSSASSPAPDLTRKVLGFRTFELAVNQLHSIGLHYAWEPGVNKAVCALPWIGQHNSSHAAPAAGCGCGLYGLHHPTSDEWADGGRLGAVILAWGRMEVHALGFRAEYAEVKALVCAARGVRVLWCLAERYGVELLHPSEVRDDRLKEWGECIPGSLLPKPEWPESVPRLGPGFVTAGRVATHAPSMAVGIGATTMAGMAAALPRFAYGTGRVPMVYPPPVRRRLSRTPFVFVGGFNVLFAGLNLFLLSTLGHWWSAVGLALNIGCVLFLVRQWRRLCRRA